MLSLGCERLPTPLKKKKKKKVLDHYLRHDLGMLPLLRCFFAHLLILQYPDHHQNLISSYLYYSGPVHKISSQSVHNFLSNVVHRQTNRQTDRQTNATKNITSFAKEVISSVCLYACCRSVARLFFVCVEEGGQIGQILGPFMITHGLSCDRVRFGHFLGGQMTPLTTPPPSPGYGPVAGILM